MGNIIQRKRTEFLFFAGFVFSFIAFRIWVLLVGGIDALYEALGVMFSMMFLIGLCIFRMRRIQQTDRDEMQRNDEQIFRPGQYRFSSRVRSSDHISYTHLDDIHEIRRLCASFPRIIYQVGQIKAFSKASKGLISRTDGHQIESTLKRFGHSLLEGKKKVFVEAENHDLEEGLDLELSTFSSSVQEDIEDDSHVPTCSVCLGDYIEGDSLMLLPCCHHFHDGCVLAWIDRKPECPLCKLDLRRVIATARSFEQSLASSSGVATHVLAPSNVAADTPRAEQPPSSDVSIQSQHHIESKLSQYSSASSGNPTQNHQPVILDIPRSNRSTLMVGGEPSNEDQPCSAVDVQQRQQVSFVYLEASGNGKTLLAINV